MKPRFEIKANRCQLPRGARPLWYWALWDRATGRWLVDGASNYTSRAAALRAGRREIARTR